MHRRLLRLRHLLEDPTPAESRPGEETIDGKHRFTIKEPLQDLSENQDQVGTVLLEERQVPQERKHLHRLVIGLPQPNVHLFGLPENLPNERDMRGHFDRVGLVQIEGVYP
jgi:hypothetical protein